MESNASYPLFSMATPLHALSRIYGGVVRQREKLYARGTLKSFRLPCPVVSVGNLMVGGLGKTPMVIHLARHLTNRGIRVAVISRGYKGSGQKNGAVVSDGRELQCDVGQAGDEPYLIAQLLENVPVLVGKDRNRAGRAAISLFDPDVIILDDAFQHLRIKRDLDLMLLDAKSPFGNAFLLPRGRLREPLAALSRADAVVLTRSTPHTAQRLPNLDGLDPSPPVFRCVHAEVIRGVAGQHHSLPPLNKLPVGVSDLNGVRLFAFAGLAHNRYFFDALRSRFGGTLAGTMAFEDHHAYGQEEMAAIGRAALDAGAALLVTTDKDYVRFFGRVQLPLDLVVMGVEIKFRDDAEQWQKYLDRQIDRMMDGKKSG
jgi:tetraacyldisaccharide 4'-kinase